MNTAKTNILHICIFWFDKVRARLTETNECKHVFCIPHEFKAVTVTIVTSV